ncbi:FkbM family methyltransferase [Falsiroseomonas sp.]|uniref:FkbM family methyltransferase n=1 Tax=Falsiroseomonas sp. TaxID=2870721 RepID=UPI00356A4146
MTASAAGPRATLAEQYAQLRERRAAGRPVAFEALLRAFYGGFLRPGDIALDLGAFKGTHTLPLAEAVRGEGGAVHAFEPNPDLAAALRRRCAHPALVHVTLHEAAAGLEDGEADFVLALDSPGYSGLRQREYDRPDMRTRTIRVRSARLDTELAGLERLAFIKADLEGGEFDALRGGAALIARTRPAIGFEFGRRSYSAYGVDPGAVFDWFAGQGYLLFDILGNLLGTRERFLRADSMPLMYEYLALPQERRDLHRLARGLAAQIPDWPWGGGAKPSGATRHLVIPGLAKAGTTFLFEQLAAQPALFGRAREKEIGYFSRPGAVTREDYLALFPEADRGRILLDASPAYIQNRPDTARRLREALAGDRVDVVILLRDPIDALFSHYLHDLKSTIGRPSWIAERPESYALSEEAVLARYLRPRAAAVEAFKDVFGERCRGFHMAALFDGTAQAALGAMLGVELRGFDTRRVANRGGFVPGYVYGGAEGVAYRQGGQAWHVPPGTLVFVAEERSELHPDMPGDAAEALIRLGASFTAEIVLPAATLQPVVEDYLAMCRTLGLPPALKPRGEAVRFAAPRAGVSEQVLARLARL